MAYLKGNFLTNLKRFFLPTHKTKGWKRIYNPPKWVVKTLNRMPLRPFGRYYVKGRNRAYKGIYVVGREQGSTRMIYFYRKRKS